MSEVSAKNAVNRPPQTANLPPGARPAAMNTEERPGNPLFLCAVAAGFPSPADDYLERYLDLHKHLVRNQAATFFLHATGDSMLEAGIHEGDLLVVDRSVEPTPGAVVIAAVGGELTVKRLLFRKERTILAPANPEYAEIDITGRDDVHIWGVVTYAVHALGPGALGTR